MARDMKRARAGTSNRKGGSLLTGLLVGLIIGVAAAVGVALYVNRSDNPFTGKTDRPQPAASSPVQQQIDRVQTELDRLEGRLKYLNNRVDLSTITVNLQEPEPVGGETGHSFVAAINEGIAGFLGMIDALIVLFFTILPLLAIGGAAYGIYRWRNGKKPASPVPPEPK